MSQYDNELDFIPMTERPEFQVMKDAVIAFIRRHKSPTIGQISNAFPQYVDHILDVLSDLKLELKCDFDENGVAPRRVYARAMKRILPVHFKSSSVRRETVIVPDQEVFQ